MEGLSFTGLIARFTDSDKDTNASDFSAVINWGDGHTSAGQVVAETPPSLALDVMGTHTFTDEGPVSVVVNITDTDGTSTSVRTTSIVADAPIAAQGVPMSMNRNGVVSDALVATIADANPLAKTSDFTATINWGDSTTSAGIVVKGPKGRYEFGVLGSHVYHGAGPFNVQVAILDGGPHAVASQFYTAVNLTSSVAGLADRLDPNLKNPWGLVSTATSPWWNADNANGLSTLYNGVGTPSALVVTVSGPNTPPAGFTHASPSGIVAGKAGEFLLPPAAGKTAPAASFIFSTEDGTIAGWNPNSTGGSASAVTIADNSQQVYSNGGVGAVYNGLALATNAGTDLLYATNFRSGNVDVFKQGSAPNFTLQPVSLGAGAFHDTSIPSGYAPFGIQTLPNGNLVVTFAQQDSAKLDEVDGAGLGYVDEFTPDGSRVVLKIGGTGTQPEFNAPWGVALAPANFGVYSNDLLIGNFGDSHVSAFDPTSGAFLGQLSDAQGNPLVLNGGTRGPRALWALEFGNGAGSGPKTSLFFNAGINGESGGLFGAITANSLSAATVSSTASAPTGVSPTGKGKG
jgi:uncharacterized protein (TIGR03118 family)